MSFSADEYGFIWSGEEYHYAPQDFVAKFKRLKRNAILPSRGSDRAGAYDLYAALDEDVHILPGENKKIGTGWAIQPPEGFDCYIFARSGSATSRGLRPANCVGLCDEDYRGEYIVALYNDSFDEQVIHNGDRIAQLKFTKKYMPQLIEVDELDDTARGAGGFGSTGTR